MQPTSNRQVTLANGTQLTGQAAQNYGVNGIGTITTPPVNPVASIPVDGINNPVMPAITPPVVKNTTPGANNAFVDGVSSNIATNIQNQDQIARDAAKNGADNSLNDLIKNTLDIGNQGNRLNEAYQQQGVDQLKKTVDDYQGLLSGEKVALDDQIAQINADSEGTFGASREADMASVQAKSSIRQNSILLKLSLATQSYATSKDIADRQANAQLDVLKAQNDALKFVYSNNKDLFDKADAQVIKDHDRILDQAQKDKDQLTDLRLKLAQNGAPLDVLNKLGGALTIEQALAVPGLNNYLTSPADKLDLQLKKLQIQGQGLENQKKRNDLNPTNDTITAPAATSYTLQAGDDPYNIALNSGISIAYLKAANPGIKNWNNIKPGAVLKIPSTSAANIKNVNGIVENILGSGKFTKDQSTAFKSAVSNAIASGGDPATVIKNQAKNIMGQTEATTLTKYESAKSALGDLNSALSAYYAAGGSTNLLKGKTEKVINNLGNVNNPALVDLATQIAAQIQVYRNAVSGTAYSVQEGAQIDSVFPGINKTQGLNSAIISGRNKAFDSAIDGVYRTTLGDAYDQLKQTPVAQNAPTNENPAVTNFMNNFVLPSLNATSGSTSPISTFSSTFTR